MADITITATSVAPYASATTITQYLIGETITAGQVVYLKSSDSRWWKAQTDGTAAESGNGTSIGIALNGGAAGQFVAVQTHGDITIGATIATGVEYYVSNTAGGICPVADLGSADYVTIIGYGISTSVLRLDFNATGLTLA